MSNLVTILVSGERLCTHNYCPKETNSYLPGIPPHQREKKVTTHTRVYMLVHLTSPKILSKLTSKYVFPGFLGLYLYLSNAKQ